MMRRATLRLIRMRQAGLLFQASYDLAGNVTNRVLWGGTVQAGTNDAYGNPLSGLTAWVNPSDPTDLRRLTASQAYDSQGNRIQSVDPHGKVSQTLYDQSGQPAAGRTASAE